MHARRRAVGERVVRPAAAQPLADMAIDVPHQPVLGGAVAVAGDGVAVLRVVGLQWIGPRQGAVARRVERLQRRDGHRLGGDAHPRVAVADELGIRHGPANIEVEQVRRVQHLHHDRAAECDAVGGAAHEHAGGIRRASRADHGRTGGGPVVDVSDAAEQELLLDVANCLQVGRRPRVVGRAERVRRGRDRHGAFSPELRCLGGKRG